MGGDDLNIIARVLVLLGLVIWAAIGIYLYMSLITATMPGAIVGLAILFVVWIICSAVVALAVL